jgi:hypothetical protein
MKEEYLMSTATAINLDSLTTQECKSAIDRIFASAQTSSGQWLMNKEDVLIAHYGVMNNIQLRDYLMGAPSVYSLDHCITAIAKIVNVCNERELDSYAFDTVGASFYFEQGNKAQALLMLSVALEKDYSLAKLIARVILGGAPSNIFGAMRAELHSKVVDNLADTANELANEDNR